MEHVKKIKKQWLVALLVFFGVMPLGGLCGCLYLLLKENLDPILFLIISIGVLISLAMGYGLYRCSYLKKGTKFLNVVTAVYFVQSVLMLVGRSIDIWWYARLFIGGVLCAWWCVTSFRLIKMNKQTTKQKYRSQVHA